MMYLRIDGSGGLRGRVAIVDQTTGRCQGRNHAEWHRREYGSELHGADEGVGRR